jgi:hypothetical protein
MQHVSNRGKFVLLTHSARKMFYLSILTEPIPTESSFDLIAQTAFNHAICHGLGSNKGELVSLLAKTYFYQRIVRNPSYYGLRSNSREAVSDFASELVDNAISELVKLQACQVHDDDFQLSALALGQVAANHSINPQTCSLLASLIAPETGHRNLLKIICSTSEFIEIPVPSFSEVMKQFPDDSVYCVLFRCHLGRVLPADFRDVFRTCCVVFLRVVGAAIDIAAARGWLIPTVAAIQLIQRVVQSVAFEDSELLQLPNIDREVARRCAAAGVLSIDGLRDAGAEDELQCRRLLGMETDDAKWDQVCEAVNRFPSCSVEASRREGGINVVVLRDIEDGENVAPVPTAWFPFTKTENWFVVVADEAKEVVRMEKILLERECEVALDLSEDELGRKLNVFLLSDSYIGCDRACDVV